MSAYPGPALWSMQFTHSQVAANFRGSKEDPPPATKRPYTFQSVGCMAGLGPSDERLACCAWRHRSIENVFCYNCCLLRGAVVVSLSKRMDHMIVRFSECTSISHQNGCESRKRAARGLFRSSFRCFVLAYFLHFSVFLLVG